MTTSRIATLPTHGGVTLRLNYLDKQPPNSSKPKGTILLIHGFPQTSYQFRHVIPLLTNVGYRVIAPDYRGAGASSKPVSGYQKSKMATDLHHLVHDLLQILEPIHVVGHDIGGMIAHAYATLYPSEVASVVWGECPLPGTSFFEEMDKTVDMFHFVFHRVLDLPEALIQGREGLYLKHFYDKLSYNSAAIGKEDLEVYTNAFEQPGAMRAGISLYRAFDKDASENKEMVKRSGKCKVKCLILNGKEGPLSQGAEAMGKEMYEDAQVAVVPESGHYIAEENPEGFVQAVLRFLEEGP